MPTNYDFSYLENQETLELDIPGWKEVKITFATTANATQEQTIYWRVNNTEQTFKVYLSYMLEYFKDDYEEYFTKLLTDFRKNYKKWEEINFMEPWMQEYRDQFGKYII